MARIELVNLRKAYGSVLAVRDINFVIEDGEFIVFVGPSGCGKTTTLRCVAGFELPTGGLISFDSADVTMLPPERRDIGMVFQNYALFPHMDVRENLRFAQPDATDEQIEEACRAARIHDHIISLDQGYDTVVGERGYRFSGGEKQRIAIARTVLRNPPILVLDEATSALDVDTERQVQEALDALAEGRTTITIAHRLSTVRDADQILVMDAGAIVERGTHADLVAQGGRYADLVARDSLGAIA
jgi:ATP-binding cassette subfamily B protein